MGGPQILTDTLTVLPDICVQAFTVMCGELGSYFTQYEGIFQRA